MKKASAQLPPAVRDRMRHIVERFSQTSRRTYQRRGQRLVDENRMPVWQRIQRDGAIIFRPDQEHPALAEFAAQLAPHLAQGFRNCISLIGSSLPVEALHADFAGSAEEIRSDEADVDVIRQALDAMLPRLLEQGLTPDDITSMLRQVEPFRSGWVAAEPALADMLKALNDNE